MTTGLHGMLPLQGTGSCPHQPGAKLGNPQPWQGGSLLLTLPRLLCRIRSCSEGGEVAPWLGQTPGSMQRRMGWDTPCHSPLIMAGEQGLAHNRLTFALLPLLPPSPSPACPLMASKTSLPSLPRRTSTSWGNWWGDSSSALLARTSCGAADALHYLYRFALQRKSKRKCHGLGPSRHRQVSKQSTAPPCHAPQPQEATGNASSVGAGEQLGCISRRAQAAHHQEGMAEVIRTHLCRPRASVLLQAGQCHGTHPLVWMLEAGR